MKTDRALMVALGIGGMIFAYGGLCLHYGINHDISTVIITSLAGLASGTFSFWLGKRSKKE